MSVECVYRTRSTRKMSTPYSPFVTDIHIRLPNMMHVRRVCIPYSKYSKNVHSVFALCCGHSYTVTEHGDVRRVCIPYLMYSKNIHSVFAGILRTTEYEDENVCVEYVNRARCTGEANR